MLTENSVYKREEPIKKKKIKHTIARKKTSKWEIFFYVLLTVHLSIILVIDQLNAQILVL